MQKLRIEKGRLQEPRIPAAATRALRAAAVFAVALGISSCATPDRRSAEQRSDDRALADQVQVALQADPDIYAYHIDVSAKGGVVWLTGWVTSSEEADAAVRDSRAVPGVKRVVNEIDLMDWTVHY